MDKTTKLIRWQRIMIAALLLALIATSFYASIQTKRGNAALTEIDQLETQRRQERAYGESFKSQYRQLHIRLGKYEKRIIEPNPALGKPVRPVPH